MSPFESKKQSAWAHTKSGVKALGGKAKVEEWEAATDYGKLPERAKGKKQKPVKRNFRKK